MKKHKYLVRVELTHEIIAQYTLVRDGLLERGFTKRIKSLDGIEYRLPNGNYYCEGTNTADEIFKIVTEVVFRIDAKASVVVARLIEEPGSMSWANLQRC